MGWRPPQTSISTTRSDFQPVRRGFRKTRRNFRKAPGSPGGRAEVAGGPRPTPGRHAGTSSDDAGGLRHLEGNRQTDEKPSAGPGHASGTPCPTVSNRRRTCRQRQKSMSAPSGERFAMSRRAVRIAEGGSGRAGSPLRMSVTSSGLPWTGQGCIPNTLRISLLPPWKHRNPPPSA